MKQRWLAPKLAEMLQDRRVIHLQGALSSGKSELVRSITAAREGEFKSLADQGVLDFLLANTLEAMGGQDLMTIDDIHLAPRLCSGVKYTVENNPESGKFLVASSVHQDQVSNELDMLTGKVARLRLRPFGVGELQDKEAVFLQSALTTQIIDVDLETDFGQIWELALTGGYAEVQDRPAQSRQEWFDDYCRQIAFKVLSNLTDVRRPDLMLDLLGQLACFSGQVFDISKLGRNLEGSGNNYDRRTLARYVELLEAAYIIDRVPAYRPQGSASVAKPRLFVADSGLLAHLAGVKGLEDLASKIGLSQQLIETFVYAQLAAHAEASSTQVEISHYSSYQKQGLDFVVRDVDRQTYLAIEVKAGSELRGDWLASFKSSYETIVRSTEFPCVGLIFYTGSEVLKIDENCWLAPVSVLWETEKWTKVQQDLGLSS